VCILHDRRAIACIAEITSRSCGRVGMRLERRAGHTNARKALNMSILN
jgi:hypothetical protein